MSREICPPSTGCIARRGMVADGRATTLQGNSGRVHTPHRTRSRPSWASNRTGPQGTAWCCSTWWPFRSSSRWGSLSTRSWSPALGPNQTCRRGIRSHGWRPRGSRTHRGNPCSSSARGSPGTHPAGIVPTRCYRPCSSCREGTSVCQPSLQATGHLPQSTCSR